jgi:hypothetical protein
LIIIYGNNLRVKKSSLMPRKGPPRATRREDREKERQAAANRRKHEKDKSARAAEAVRQFCNNPEMPASRGEQRDLRRGLAANGTAESIW